MIKVEQLHLKNIGPFNSETLNFSIKEGHPDIHIFTGSNGSGKTTILHSIASEFDYFENNHKEHRSNLFFKRFHNFSDDENEMAKSYVHAILKEKTTNEIVDKIACYGCKTCGNLHQNYEKALQKNNKIHQRGSGYGWKAHHQDLANYKNAIIAKDLSNKKFKFAVFGYSGYRFVNSAKIQIDNEDNFNPLHLALEFVKEKNTGFLVSNWIVSRYSKAAIEENRGNHDIADRYREAINTLITSINDLTDNEFSFEIQTNPWKVVLKYFEKEIEFDVLPDGLRSLLSWLGDLLMRLDEIPWADTSIPVNHQNIILLLDEIEVHLHPKWQYQILPLTYKLFPNAQIFLSTHSPFVINSIDNAKIYKLKSKSGKSSVESILHSNTGDSYSYVFENILDTTNDFGFQTMKNLKRFNELDQEIVKNNFENEAEFREITKKLIEEGEEVNTIISSKLKRLERITGKDFLNGEN